MSRAHRLTWEQRIALHAARTTEGLTRAQLAVALGVDPSTVARWEEGVSFPSPMAGGGSVTGPRRLAGYRVAVAYREDHRTPPPREHRDWLRITRPTSPGDDGLAEQRDVAAGYVFAARRAALWEAQEWAEHWHARIVTVWRRGRDA